MKRKYTEGSSLIEVLVAIVILALIVVPTCTSLVMSSRINAKAEQLLQDQLAVSSAVETLMAEGFDPNNLNPDSHVYNPYGPESTVNVYSDVFVTYEEAGNCYKITVETKDGEVSVTTQVRGGGA